MAAQQALETLLAVMPPLRCVDILAHKLPSDEAVASGTAVDGEVLCATIRSLQVRLGGLACLLAVSNLHPGFHPFQAWSFTGWGSTWQVGLA